MAAPLLPSFKFVGCMAAVACSAATALAVSSLIPVNYHATDALQAPPVRDWIWIKPPVDDDWPILACCDCEEGEPNDAPFAGLTLSEIEDLINYTPF